MTMPELLAELEAAQKEARDRGADDAEVNAIRREIIDRNRTATTGQEYVNQWSPGIPPVPEPKRRPTNPGRTTDRKGDLF